MSLNVLPKNLNTCFNSPILLIFKVYKFVKSYEKKSDNTSLRNISYCKVQDINWYKILGR